MGIKESVNFNVGGIGQMRLGIKDDGVSLPEDQIPAGYQGFIAAFDQDDDSLSGDFQLVYVLVDPGVIFLKDDFLQSDAFLGIAERFRAKDHIVSGAEYDISPGDDDFVISLNGGYDYFGRKVQLCDGVLYPGIVLGEMDLDEMNGSLLAVFAHSFDAGILVNETGGNNTGGYRYDSNTQKSNEDTEHFSKGGDGINIPVSNCEERGSSPPDTGKGIGKHIGLYFVLQAVHTQAGGDH